MVPCTSVKAKTLPNPRRGLLLVITAISSIHLVDIDQTFFRLVLLRCIISAASSYLPNVGRKVIGVVTMIHNAEIDFKWEVEVEEGIP